jgi:hypothetical protein
MTAVRRARTPAELGARPRERQRRHICKNFFALLTRNPGEWTSLPSGAIGGDTATGKHTRIHSGARQMGVRVQTTIQGGRVYARIVESEPKAGD